MREGSYVVLGVDVRELLDQVVAQSFHLGLNCVHQDSLALCTASPCQAVKLCVPGLRIPGRNGHLRPVEVGNRGRKMPHTATSECYASFCVAEVREDGERESKLTSC